MIKTINFPDYTPSGFFKLTAGENKLRILSNPEFGYEYWLNKKPYRFAHANKPIPPAGADPLKPLWVFKVYDCKTNTVNLWELSKPSIQKALQSLIESESWGDPTGYPISITVTGSGMDTRYAVLPLPKEPLSSEIQKLSDESTIDLSNIFNSGGTGSKRNTEFNL